MFWFCFELSTWWSFQPIFRFEPLQFWQFKILFRPFKRTIFFSLNSKRNIENRHRRYWVPNDVFCLQCLCLLSLTSIFLFPSTSCCKVFQFDIKYAYIPNAPIHSQLGACVRFTYHCVVTNLKYSNSVCCLSNYDINRVKLTFEHRLERLSNKQSY